MYYSAIGTLALLILLIENMDILLNRNDSFSRPAWKVYRKFLFAVLVYYVTDIIWGFLESRKLAVLLFADTTVYFIAMAAGVLYWTQYAVIYLEEKRIYGRIFMYSGRIFAAAVCGTVIANIFTPVLFVVDAECVYSALPVRYLVLSIQILLLLLISAFTFTAIARHHAAGKAERYRTLGLFGIIMAVFLTAQLWYPYLPLYSIAYMLGTCLLRAFVVGNEKEEYRFRLEETTRNTEKRLAEKQAAEEHAAYTRISALGGEYLSVHIVDPETERYHEYSANAGFKSFGLPAEGADFFNVTRELSRGLVHPDDLDLFLHAFTRENVLSEIENTGLFALTYRLMVQGNPVYIRLKCVMVEEAEGRRLIVGINDVDAQVKQEEEYENRLLQAQKRATIDVLTGVKNKYSYQEAETQMNRRIAEKTQPAFAMIVLDVNDLKKVNDTLGHQAGDQYLCDACRFVCRTFKHSPVFRIGGDEFAVIAQGHDYEHAGELTATIEEYNLDHVRNGGIVIACGMSEFRDDPDVASVFRRADKAMYADKQRLKESGPAQDGRTGPQ